MAERLKPQYDSADEIPEPLRDLYEEREGKFVLPGVEGFVEKKRLDEFRASNIKLSQDLEKLKAQFEGIDPDDVKALRSKVAEMEEKRQEIEDQRLLDEKNIEEIRRQATKKVVEERDKGFKEREQRITALEERLNTLLITDELRRIGASKKIHDWAIEDLVRIGSQVVALDEHSQPVVYEIRNGQRTLRYNDEGDPLTLEQWADEQIALRSSGWLPPSSGGGTHHQGSGNPQNGTARVNTKPVAQWTTAEKVKFIGQHGADAWDRLVTQGSPG